MIAGFFRRRRFMREHRWTQDHLSPYLDRELKPEGRDRLEHHTDLCPECRRALATLKRTLQALRRLGIDQDTPGPSELSGPAVTPGPMAESVIGYLRRSG